MRRAIIINPPQAGVRFERLPDENRPAPNQIKVRAIYTGICGTDRELANGLLKHSIPPEGKEFMILGHEVIGEVVDKGKDVDEFEIGDKVVGLARRRCGKCLSCEMGRPDLCETGQMPIAGVKGKDGFMADTFNDEAKFFVKLPDTITDESAVLIQPLGDIIKAVYTGINALNSRFTWYCRDSTLRCRTAMILGTGSTGLLFSMLLKTLGLKVILVNRRGPTSAEESITKSVGVSFLRIDEELPLVDLLIDTSGSTVSLLRALQRVRPNGGVILFGFGLGDESTFKAQHLTDLVYRNILVLGSAAHGKIHLEEAVKQFEIIKSYYNEAIKKMITRVIYPEEAIPYIMKKQENEIKIVMKWR
ncbi:alcohol dehydrogenase catalytic domain-containing protein [Metallosphaera javensis (ex Sakai et al. 2022)]|uniref:alcohol dehydrogenase catalytic domain-containing protein n=1 Tax=Metallosphaera javensis (ex Sakai et al. 2022) TaxID=2775498 RepID=UPI00258EC8F3